MLPSTSKNPRRLKGLRDARTAETEPRISDFSEILGSVPDECDTTYNLMPAV